MLTLPQLTAVRNQYGVLPNLLTLYHGTNSATFFAQVCGHQGFTSNEAFMGKYSLAGWVGGNAVYGPGLYLADTVQEAQNYGHLIIRCEVEATTDYLDFQGHGGAAVVAHSGGSNRQNILSEARLYCLLRVTQRYYTLRTPFNVIMSPN